MRFTKNKKIAAGVVGAAALAIGGAGVAIAGGDDEGSSKPVTGPALKRATEAAIAVTGPGAVTESEVGDEEGAYEIEITHPDGSKDEVHLDADFNVIGSSGEEPSEGNGSDADGGSEG